MKPSYPVRLALMGLMAGVLVSCQNVALVSSGGPAVARAPEAALPGGGGSLARWRADYQRLPTDIPRAVRNCGWGLASLDVQTPSHDTSDAGLGDIVASLWLPNERRGVLKACAEADGQISVAIRAGHQGDSASERRFLTELARLLRGRPARKYHERFGLSE